MHSPIQNEDPPDRRHLLHNFGSDGDIVEEAKAHGPIGFRVVTRRANDRERFLQIATSDGKGSLDDPSTAQERRLGCLRIDIQRIVLVECL